VIVVGQISVFETRHKLAVFTLIAFMSYSC